MGEQLQHQQFDNPEKRNLSDLKFEELQKLAHEVAELARKTFKHTVVNERRVTDRFTNANGNGVSIMQVNGLYKAAEASSELQELHVYIAAGVGSSEAGQPNALKNGTKDKDQAIRAMKQMLADVGFRIIE